MREETTNSASANRRATTMAGPRWPVAMVLVQLLIAASHVGGSTWKPSHSPLASAPGFLRKTRPSLGNIIPDGGLPSHAASQAAWPSWSAEPHAISMVDPISIAASSSDGGTSGQTPISVRVDFDDKFALWRSKIEDFFLDLVAGARDAVIFGKAWRRKFGRVVLAQLFSICLIPILARVPASVQVAIGSSMCTLCKPLSALFSKMNGFNLFILKALFGSSASVLFTQVEGVLTHSGSYSSDLPLLPFCFLNLIIDPITTTIIFQHLLPKLIRTIHAKHVDAAIQRKNKVELTANTTDHQNEIDIGASTDASIDMEMIGNVDADKWISMAFVQPLIMSSASACTLLPPLNAALEMAPNETSPVTTLSVVWVIAVSVWSQSAHAVFETIPILEAYGMAGTLGQTYARKLQALGLKFIAGLLFRVSMAGRTGVEMNALD
mmetsp:Transcript_6617/g.17966  ORF Transcript_6617/g.17966 Transcript_6617/m.17966 type:complete len:437 (-) Transcript_6617:1330-2640(-)